MTHTDKATPRPWQTVTLDGDVYLQMGNGKEKNSYNGLLAKIGEPLGADKKANAELIVRAVNAHDALVWALQRVENWMSINQHYGVLLDDVREALKQAGEV